MIFGFGKKKDDEQDDEEVNEVDYVLFQGALNGKEPNLAANARLAQAGLIPTKEIITDAIERRASQVRIEPKGERALVQYSIDGVPAIASRLSKQQAHAVTQLMKLLAGLNTQQRQHAQAGGVRAELKGTKYELRVSSTPAGDGVERLIVKIRDLSRAFKTTEEVGFSNEMKEKVRELTAEKKGIILICGGPGSGVSTTTYAVLRSVDAYQYTVYAVGDRQGWELPNVSDFEATEGEELATTLDRAIRSEADVIYIDPLRDAETAQLIVKLQPRACFITEFSGSDAIGGIMNFAKLVGSAQVAADSLAAAISQRLIRTLCKDCRLAYRPNPKAIAKIGLPPETKSLYRAATLTQRTEESPAPCQTCGGTGYIGRTAMFEVIEMTPAIRKLVAAGASSRDIRTQARDEKMIMINHEGLKLVVEGKTSLEELQRVLQPKK